jgi:hypothetical protein
MLQHETAQGKEVRYLFGCEYFSTLQGDCLFIFKVAFGDEATFHVSVIVRRRNLSV